MNRLHAGIKAKGICCWFAPENMKPGEKIWFRIDKMIHVREKLLLVLSTDAVGKPLSGIRSGYNF